MSSVLRGEEQHRRKRQAMMCIRAKGVRVVQERRCHGQGRENVQDQGKVYGQESVYQGQAGCAEGKERGCKGKLKKGIKGLRMIPLEQEKVRKEEEKVINARRGVKVKVLKEGARRGIKGCMGQDGAFKWLGKVNVGSVGG